MGAGIWGTIATGLYGNLEVLGTGLTRVEQISVQLVGIVSYGVWGFCVPFAIFFAINRVKDFRVSKEHELLGLNISEHGMKTETDVNGPNDYLSTEVET